MSPTQHKVKAMNIGLTKSAVILADNFVDFKRKVGSELCLSGWLEVRVYKAEVKAEEGLILKSAKLFSVKRKLLRTWCLREWEQSSRSSHSPS